ncbi:MAG: BatA domain-containing protein [Candidatus Cloacimonadales bacterium]
MFSLSFLNSGLLIASLSALIPLLIYFFAKKRPDRVIFSSIRFITLSKDEKKSKINLKNILLLIIRTLIFLLLALIFARPIIETFLGIGSNYHAPTTISIIADNSWSMDYYSKDTQRLELLKQKLKTINGKLTDEDFIRIYTKDNYITSQKFMQGAIADTLIQNIPLSYQDLPLDSLIVQALHDKKDIETANFELYLITDMNEQLTYQDSLTKIKLIEVDNHKEWNNLSATITSVQIGSTKNVKQLSIDFVIHNYGEKEVTDRLVRLNYNDRSYDRFVTIEANKSWQGNYTLPIEKSGWQKGFIEIQDEFYLKDNRAYFSSFFNLAPQITIITEEPSISLPLKTMVNIFAGDDNNVKYIPQNYVNNQLLATSDIVIFYKLNSLESNVKTLTEQLRKSNKGSLFILGNKYDKSVENYLNKKFSLELGNGVVNQIFPDWHNPYNKLINSLSVKQFPEMRFNGVAKASFKNNSRILLASNRQPLIAQADNDFLFLFDDNNDFVTNSSYPVFMNKIFEQLSISELEVSTNYVGNQIPLSKNAEVNDQKQIGNSFVFSDVGIYKVLSESGKLSYESVNLGESLLKESRVNNDEVNNSFEVITDNWEGHLFAESGRFELLKYLLIGIMVLFVAELVIVKFG